VRPKRGSVCAVWWTLRAGRAVLCGQCKDYSGGCHIGSNYPIAHIKYDQAYPVHFLSCAFADSAEGPQRRHRRITMADCLTSRMSRVIPQGVPVMQPESPGTRIAGGIPVCVMSTGKSMFGLNFNFNFRIVLFMYGLQHFIEQSTGVLRASQRSKEGMPIGLHRRPNQ
jgi:hypothetical protein